MADLYRRISGPAPPHLRLKISLISWFIVGGGRGFRQNNKVVNPSHLSTPNCRTLFLQIGDTALTVDGNPFVVQVMDSVKDYAEYMKEIFDFDAIKKLITGADGKKPFNVLFNAMHGGMYVILSRISKFMIILFILDVVNAITARQRSCGKVMFSVMSVCSHHGPHPYPSVYRALVLTVQTCSTRTSLNRAHPLDMFRPLHYEARTVGKRPVGIPLECFLVHSLKRNLVRSEGNILQGNDILLKRNEGIYNMSIFSCWSVRKGYHVWRVGYARS